MLELHSSLATFSSTTWARLDPFSGLDDSIVGEINTITEAKTPVLQALKKAVGTKLLGGAEFDLIEKGRIFLLDGGDPDAFKVLCAILAELRFRCRCPARVDARALADMYTQRDTITLGLDTYTPQQLGRNIDLLSLKNFDSFNHDRLKDKVASIISPRVGAPVITILECANVETTLDEFGMLRSSFNARRVTRWPS